MNIMCMRYERRKEGLKGGKTSVWGNVYDVTNIFEGEIKKRDLATCNENHSLIEGKTRG